MVLVSAATGDNDRAVGITDLLAHRECPRRASYGRRRHTGIGQQDPVQRTPEAGSRAAGYGSCVHEAIAAIEDGYDDEQAIQRAWNAWGHWLEPEDLDLLRADIENFHNRDFPNTRTVLSEDEIRVPLVLHDGKLAYFRARIDRLYERLDAPGHFILVDYKSSRHAKSESDVFSDLQLRSYDWSVREYLPEIEEMVCIYDQLRYGQIPARWSDEQRVQIREFLNTQMTTYFADENVQADGLLAPRHNQWCPWCPILESCSIVDELSEFALSRIAGIRGEDIAGGDGLGRYSELYSTAKDAAKVIKRFVDSMNEVARELPAESRESLGFHVGERRQTTFTPEALSRLQARIGEERFLELVSLPKTRLDALEDEVREWALSMAASAAPSAVVTRKEPQRR